MINIVGNCNICVHVALVGYLACFYHYFALFSLYVLHCALSDVGGSTENVLLLI